MPAIFLGDHIVSTVENRVQEITAAVLADQLAGKPFWLSRTFWVNTLALLAILAQTHWGFIIGAEYQALALTLVNLVLRKITNQAVTW